MDTAIELKETKAYLERGLSDADVAKLSVFGGLLLASRSNVTAIRDPHEVELTHFLDSLSFVDVAEVREADRILDVGSGGGLPAVVLAIALPATRITALDSVRKKCAFVEEVADRLELGNLDVVCARAEDLGRTERRESYDVAVSRAVASLPVLAELMVPMIRQGGALVAAKGTLSDEERMDGEAALAILGCNRHEAVRARSFAAAHDRWLFVAHKTRATPSKYPRRAGMPGKRPLGAHVRD